MTFRIGLDDPRRKLAEAKVMEILSGLQDLHGFGDTVPRGPAPERNSDPLPVPTPGPDGIVILVDYRSNGITLAETARLMERYRADPEYRGYDIVLDGDLHAIVAKPVADPSQPLIGRMMLP